MSESEGIPERVTRTEHNIIEARADAKIARLLAAEADRDVSEVRAELRAHKSSLEALRKTQLDHGREMHQGFADIRTEMHEGFDEMRSKFVMVDAGFAEMRSKFATVGQGLEQITTLLTDEMNKPGNT